MSRIINANANGETDGTAFDFLSKYLNVDIPVVLTARPHRYVFNEELKRLDRYVLVDFTELGWDADHSEGHIWGRETIHGHLFEGDEWSKLNDFVATKPPIMSFYRELLKKDANELYRPIEYPAWFQYESQSRESFERRPIECFLNWGLSNPCRPRLHGEIWSKSQDYGYIVGDSFQTLDAFLHNENNPRKWVTINTPHYTRNDLFGVVLRANGLSKISISLHGSGRKCFRSAEAPINSVMAMPYDNLAWSFEWESAVNCIRLHKDLDTVAQLNAAVGLDFLYDIYCAGNETARKYHLSNYMPYLENIINKL